jgi:hypothetical protein
MEVNNMEERAIVKMGPILIKDYISGKYLTSTMDDILKVKNRVNEDFAMSGYTDHYLVIVDRLRSELGLPTIPECNRYYNIDHWQTGRPLALDFYPQIDKDGQPCLVLDFNIRDKDWAL